MAKSQIKPKLVDEADRLLDQLGNQGFDVRALGGIAVKIVCGSKLEKSLDREVADIDLITVKKQGSKVGKALEELGWEPDKQFNALNGARRMIFEAPDHGHKVDVFIDAFEMCHTIPLKNRVTVHPRTLAPADLLLTKMQIVELNEKDRNDIYALLAGVPVTDDDEDGISLERITDLTSSDWGLHHTCEINLERLRDGLSKLKVSKTAKDRIKGEIDRLEKAMEDAPKSRGWKLRAKIGEKKLWYEEVNEVD